MQQRMIKINNISITTMYELTVIYTCILCKFVILIDNNLALESAMKLIFVPFCLSWDELFAYKISAKSIDIPKSPESMNYSLTAVRILVKFKYKIELAQLHTNE